MHETATLHFDLSHLSPDQPFTLHAGSGRYDLTPHTRQTLARSRRSNAALESVPDDRVTHFCGPVRLPGNAPVLLRVTALKRDPDELLDRLVLTSVHLPRRHRVEALARQKRRLRGQPMPVPPSLAALGVVADGIAGLPPDQVLIDAGDLNSALEAAVSLVFHHAELLTLQPAPAADIVTNMIPWARGLYSLRDSIHGQSVAHEADPAQPNWVCPQPGKDWKTGQPLPGHPVYQWSPATLAALGVPLRATLEMTKDASELEHQCWTVQPGITQVPMTVAPAQRQLRDAAEAAYTVKEVTPQSGVENSFAYEPVTAAATVRLKNYYLRWLQVCVDQYGPGGEQVGQMQVLGQQSPVDTIMAAPLPPDWSDYPFTFEEKASRATVSFGGLGQVPFDWAYDSGGIIWTAIFNYAIPTLFIALGKAVDMLGKEWTAMTKNVVSKMLGITEAAAEGPLGDAVTGSNVQMKDVLLAVANCAGSMLVGLLADEAAAQLQAYIAETAGQAAAEIAEPFVGWIAFAVGAAADLASIVETSVEVARSPATMSIGIERTMDVSVTVEADLAHQGQWPATATHYTISVTYDDGPVHPYEGQMEPATQSSPITHTFTGLPAGGNITVLASFYSATGWLAGQGRSGSLAAQPDQGSTLVVPPFAIKENLVPLSADTTYTFKEKLAFASGARTWLAPPAISAPTATVSDLDAANTGSNLGQLGQLTLNEAESALGYSWQASGQDVPLAGTGSQPYTGQEFTFQALSDTADPQSGLKFSGVGWTAKPCLAFPPPTMPSPAADGLLLEPDPASKSGDMLLRAVSLVPGQPLIASPGQSFGRFTGVQDDLVIHPAGYAVALNSATCKLQVLRLGAQAADGGAPAAAIFAGRGTRPGLLYSPVAVACSLDKIMVLDEVPLQNAWHPYPQGCVWAFDVKGNPVNCFAGNAPVMGLHPEGTARVEIVDLSVEAKGYLYVLKYLRSGAPTVAAADYRLDIYNPDGTFLAQVAGLAAARLHVGLWRNIFTLNFEILPGSGRTEPSIAQWTPSTPGTDAASQGGS